MLIACPACHRQYDVGDLEPGSLVRCHCGVRCDVPRFRSRQIEMLHCSNCGGKLGAGATACEYCEAEVRLGEKGLGEACPECLSRMVVGASFCSTCGTRIDPQRAQRALTSWDCPRCTGKLTRQEGGPRPFVECTSCGGIWLDEETFGALARDATPLRADPFASIDREVATLPTEVRRPGYLPCPVCSEMMTRKNYARISGVIIDWCRGHGYWFDSDEIERVIDFLSDGGLDKARRLEAERDRIRVERASRREISETLLAPRHGYERHRHRAPGSIVDTLADIARWILDLG